MRLPRILGCALLLVACGRDDSTSIAGDGGPTEGRGSPRDGGVSSPPTASLDGRMTPPVDFDPAARYAWDAPAPTIVVDTLAEAPGKTTLARALATAADGAVIAIDPSLAGAVLKTTAPLVVARSVTIDASRAPGFGIDAGGTPGGIRVGKDLRTRFVGLTIANVRTTEVGGGIYVDQADGAELGRVEVIGCRFVDNRGAAAGGLYVRRRVHALVRDSVFERNVAIDAAGGDDRGKAGGAISARAEASITIERVRFTGNDGPEAGALYTIGTILKVVHGVFDGNGVGGAAGHGAILTDGGSVTVDGTLFRGNRGDSFGGAIQLYGYLDRGDRIVVQRSVFLENETTNDKGGAAYLIGDEIVVDSSVFVKNRAKVDAGGIYFPGDGSVKIRNSIFGENEAKTRSGGGFRRDGGGPLTIEASLFHRNSSSEFGGGFWMNPSIGGRYSKTIFSANTVGPYLASDDFVSGGGNLFFPIPDPSDRSPGEVYADPKLGPLTETRGVWWYPPATASPAIGIGPSFPETQG
jgi:hypothetical protein